MWWVLLIGGAVVVGGAVVFGCWRRLRRSLRALSDEAGRCQEAIVRRAAPLAELGQATPWSRPGQLRLDSAGGPS
ncbi:MAG: hypothetical protein LBK42_02215 [Propionibacteriaceae bacterium]|nr:hypothetical protein [Propionibacteriaceae bacterium]